MRYFVTLGGREITVDATRAPDGSWSAVCGGSELRVEVDTTKATQLVRVDGRIFDVLVDGRAPTLAFSLGRSPGVAPSLGRTRGVATIDTARSRSMPRAATRDGARGGVVPAPMPGRVVRVLVRAGQEVQKGTPLVVIEAMKMENELRSPRDGSIAEVLVSAGDTVERGARLVVLAP
jgi:biotin carboxyl carrier protein